MVCKKCKNSYENLKEPECYNCRLGLIVKPQKQKGLYSKGASHLFLKVRYNGQIGGSKKRGHKPPLYSLDEFILKFSNDKKFIKLFKTFLKAGSPNKLTPSFNRLDNSKGYSFDNIEVITWGEHQKISCVSEKSCIKVKRVTRLGQTIDGYDSMSEAGRMLSKACSYTPTTIASYISLAINNTNGYSVNLNMYFKKGQ